MRLYLAGLYTSNFDLGGRIYNRLTDNEKAQRDSAEFILESYHYINRPSFVKKIRKDNKKVFLDSGAFSAFTKGVDVDLERYCQYIHEHQDIVEHASVLDAIGDAKGTLENQKAMEQLGVNPLPCFHYGEDEKYLKHYVENYPYITLGGMVPISTQQLRYWLDRLWKEYFTDAEGKPTIKVHGFGLTSLPLMERYPWYSVDSSTWVQWAANGMLLVTPMGQINISDKSSARKIAGQHYDNLPPIQQRALCAQMEKLGGDVPRLRSEYLARWAFNVFAFPHHMRHKTDYMVERFVPEQQGLF